MPILRAGSKVGTRSADARSKRPTDSALKQQRLWSWRPVLSPRVAIATFLAFGVAFIAIGIPVLISAAGVVEVTSVDYADSSVCSSNPCEFELEVTERLVAPVYMYYRLTNYYQNHRLYVRDRDDPQLIGQSGLDQSLLPGCTAATSTQGSEAEFRRLVNGETAGEGGFGWSGVDAMENVISPCGRVASSVFNDTLTLLKPGGTEVSQSSKGIAWATDVEFKFHNAADGSTGTNFAQFAFERNQPCAEFGEGVPTTLSGPVKLDADGRYNGMLPADWIDECVAKNADAERAPGGAGANIGWCFPGSGMCVEDEHFIVWMRTAGQANFRKLYATIDEDLEPGTYTVRVSNGVDAGGGYKKYSYDKAPTASCDSLTAPAEQAPEEPCVIEEAMEGLYNTSVFGGTKKVVLSELMWLGGKNTVLGVAFVAAGALWLALGAAFLIKDRLSPRPLGSAPFLAPPPSASA
ncbi:hypothetical protein EMIHUDRAFT_368244 [Emiliania huxleyi CCMP1516]|uniref:Cell cycle control protein n=2 Tax=Emiliania huxleyi TaxID=2903 RepID=A0A0D3JGK1_EMIH1|nr:hypothetical protein EMIHUDRAFT_368295 [Emiliania huxleyi CCMP1516]XP_005775704.1 hypothetical protein EMIHUDRAFT_368244 [Emiliania huxleyi CCMP1516]EOD22636.1 hypothetical protein EMIHUDRAFT_368295 [Emiliania huxleyi CCMP1516]EOD23275.1 hypothetical protein EMIHUDRAFT_368244 [Emiliania huxleyi CCMP1516]|eukprot:XP_005775065.1 hypothetical protein EMIHUDRAFT_368295 [Emiliania huxleyi CCMP1516]